MLKEHLDFRTDSWTWNEYSSFDNTNDINGFKILHYVVMVRWYGLPQIHAGRGRFVYGCDFSAVVAVLSTAWWWQSCNKSTGSLRFNYRRRRRFVMAVDLTPRFRRLNSQTRSFRVNIQHGKILCTYSI